MSKEQNTSKPEEADNVPSPATGRVKVDTNIKVEDRTEEAPVHDPYAREPKVTTRTVGNVTIEDRT